MFGFDVPDSESWSTRKRPHVFSTLGFEKYWRISASLIVVKSTTVFSQAPQNLPWVSGVIVCQSSWHGFSMEMRIFFMTF
jgi:hypothetical protein